MAQVQSRIGPTSCVDGGALESDLSRPYLGVPDSAYARVALLGGSAPRSHFLALDSLIAATVPFLERLNFSWKPSEARRIGLLSVLSFFFFFVGIDLVSAFENLFGV